MTIEFGDYFCSGPIPVTDRTTLARRRQAIVLGWCAAKMAHAERNR